jgi:tRNA U34 5-methylaminomethyl-2-thiouridine-forming methyltransferase MnmC
MTADDQSRGLDWLDNAIPVSRQFCDPYFSLDGGLAEANHVFLAGNGLPGRLCAGFHIAELGFGTGLNMLAVLQAWRDTGRPGAIRFTSFEAWPLATGDIARALQTFPAALDLAAPFLDHWAAGRRHFVLPGIEVTVIEGDARDTLPLWAGRADAWFLDGFSPAKNPELWSDALLAQVAVHTGPGGSFATYTAAGHVRRALQGAGFAVTRLPGFGRKRHMSAGHLA